MKTAKADELIREIRELREEVARLRIAAAPRFYPVYPTYIPWTPQPSYVPWYQTQPIMGTFTVQNNDAVTLNTTNGLAIGGGSC